MLDPLDFDVDEAWIAFQVTSVPIRVVGHAPVHCFVLMDAASGYLLGHVLVSAKSGRPTAKQSVELLEKGWAGHEVYPKTLFVARELKADALAKAATERKIEVVAVPALELELCTADVRAGFGAQFGG